MTKPKFITEPPTLLERSGFVHCTFSGFDRRCLPAVIIRSVVLSFYLGAALSSVYLYQDMVAVHWLYTIDHAPRPTNELTYTITVVYLWTLSLAFFAAAGQMAWELATKSLTSKDFYVPRSAEMQVLNELQKISRL